MSISQTGYIAAFLVIGFIVFIAARNEIGEYRKVIGI